MRAKGAPPPAQLRGERLPLLWPAAALVQAVLGTAGTDTPALPDLQALPLRRKSKEHAFLQGQPVSSRRKPNGAPTGEGRTQQTVTFHCSSHQQSGKKTENLAASSQIMPWSI